MKNKSIMTFNVLNAWSRISSVYKTAMKRGVGAAAFVLEQLPDVLCLQEFDYYYRHDTEFLSLLANEYAEADTHGELGAQSWNPILYRKSTYRLVASGGLDFAANGFTLVFADAKTYPEKACNEYQPYRYPEGSPEQISGVAEHSRFRCLSWAVLNDENGDRIIVGNTHYSVRSCFHQKEVEFVWSVLDDLQKKFACPILMCGDFNSAVGWGAAKHMLEKGMLDTYDMAIERDDRCSCHESSGKGGSKDVDKMPGGSYKTHAIDHIFTTQQLTVESYRIFAEERLLSVSDHCPTMIRFQTRFPL